MGIDYADYLGSSLQFVTELLMMVVEGAGLGSTAWRGLSKLVQALTDKPLWLEVLYGATYLPNPPGGRQLVYTWGKLGKWRKGELPLAQLAS